MFAESVSLLGILPPSARAPCSHAKKEVAIATCSFLQGKGQLLTDVSVDHSGACG